MSYAAGTVVYAKLKGYPWWPARVEVESTLPSNVLSKKPKGPKPIYGVRFYGTRDYGWFGNNDLRPFDKKEAEVSLQKMKSKKRDKMLERSIREALDPSSFEDPMEEDAEEEAATEDDAELEEESKKSNESLENDDDIEYDKKPKSRGKGFKKTKKLTSPKASERRKKSPGSTKSKRKDRVYSSGDEETVSRSEKIGKKRRSNEGSNLDKSSKRKKKFDYTDDDEMELDEPSTEERRQNLKDRGASRSEGSKSPGKSDNGSPAGEDENKQITADDNNKTSKLESEGQSRPTKSRQTKSPSIKLLHLRHKVQRMVLKNPEFEKLDKSKVDELFTEVENFPITIPLLKESKIGKVMRKIAELKIEPDNYNIIGRSEELIKKWKCLLEPPTHEGTEEDASPKMAQTEGESPQNEEVIKYEDNNQAMKTGKEPEIKKEEQDHTEKSEGNFTKEISSMDVDPIESRVEEEKHITGDNIVTNESPSTTNSQGGPTNESEVHTKTEL